MAQDRGRSKVPLPQGVAGLILWAIVGGLVWFTRGLPFTQEGAPGPRFMPVLLAVFLGILNVLYWAETWVAEAKKLSLPRFSQLLRPAGFMLMGVLMILLWERLGVVPTILVLSLTELKLLEGYSWRRSILAGFVLSIGTWILFQVILGIPLPTGIFPWLANF